MICMTRRSDEGKRLLLKIKLLVVSISGTTLSGDGGIELNEYGVMLRD